MSGVVLVATKLHAPDVRPGIVPREELVARLSGSAQCKLALVCAPAGWGKTVLLAQWRASEAERRPFAWVSLDPGDDDPVRFWSYVVVAMRTVVPGFGGAVLATLPNAGSALVEAVLPQLINELAELPEPVVLVLDDFHALRDEQVHASLGFLLRHLPRTLQLVLDQPRRPAAAARAPARRGRAGRDPRAASCSSTARDADALLNGSLALGLGAGDIELLRRRTEGWPAGLQLAGLSLRDRDDRSGFIRTFAGDDRQIGDYLHEVIEGAPRPMREFLLRTSILERMCAPLCDAVTGSQRRRGAAGRGVSLEPVRGRARRSRPLVSLSPPAARPAAPRAQAGRAGAGGRAARARLRVVSKRRRPRRRDRPRRSPPGEVDEATDLISRHWQRAWHVDPRTVSRWLDELPAGTVEADPRLCLIRGWTSMFLGRLDEVEPMIVASERIEREVLPRRPRLAGDEGGAAALLRRLPERRGRPRVRDGRASPTPTARRPRARSPGCSSA